VVDSGKLSGHPSERAFYEVVRARGELLWRDAPHTAGPWRETPISFQPMDAAPSVIWRVLSASAVGTPVEIYRVGAR
jgi:hypothetical protein